ncbi:MAG: hypothetical protein M1132_10110 [Chloroflexi bacterium]|nr:hypothetical protein [Chloroflexota bacterium]
MGQPGAAGGGNAHLFGPEGVAVDSSGRVYVEPSLLRAITANWAEKDFAFVGIGDRIAM